MEIALIAAMSENRVIGRDNAIPWRIKGEQQRFKALTTGNVVIFGRKTYESIGRALPNRTNIIISSQTDYQAPGCTVVASLDAAFDACDEDARVFVGGGERVYRDALPRADLIHLTTVDGHFEGDSYFPQLPEGWFSELSSERVQAEIPYTYRIYRRTGAK